MSDQPLDPSPHSIIDTTLSTPKQPFVHLHCHSHYSLLDGAGKVKPLIKRAKELGMTALALTDHGNLYGALEFYQACQSEGIKPIIGYEAYIAPQSRFKRGASSQKEAAYHLTLLAQNRTGYQNLLRLASKAYIEGFYFRPRIDKEILEEFNEGLIVLSGCMSGEIPRLVRTERDSDLEKAVEVANWYKSVFDDRYFLEIQENGMEEQLIVNRGCSYISSVTQVPLVATSDVHYVYPEDWEAQDLLLCINTGKFRTDSNRMKIDTDQLYLRSPEDMYAAFPENEDALRRSQEIADSVNIDLDLGQRFFPVFTPPDGKESNEYLRELCIKGLLHRYAGDSERIVDGELSDVVMARLDRELDVIKKLGFPDYFLIVWDFVRVAEERGIQRTARGSGVGAIVCYALDMSHVCPLKYDLLFERFLDESRLEAPDIDIDFDQQRRGEILEYVKEKYGIESVAQIGTFGTMAAKMAIRDVGRALGLPLERVNQVTSKVPEAPKMTIAKAFKASEELRKEYDSNSEVRELIDYAKQCEGLARSAGTHACAVVIANGPLTDYLPLQQLSGKEEITTQWAMADVESAGLLKMDFLGLRNLTILASAIDIIEQTTGERIDPYKFPLDDRETYALLCRGETKGVFQLEGGGIRELLKRMKPDNFNDIIATLALYRPGPLEGGMVDQYIEVKHGRQVPDYPHEIMRDILHETNGVMVYQEQVMRILNRLGGTPLASAYTCIKAIGKKKEKVIKEFKGAFVEGVQKNGLPESKGIELFEMIEKFAGYGFNKSHSTAYALIAYMTAYLKAHYPVEFMAALLTGDIPNRNFSKKDSTVEHIEDCERMEIEVIPPDVQHSNRLYRVDDKKIFFALAAVKGCSDGAADAISNARKKGGPFVSLFDFCERVDPKACGRATIETLIKAGAFDSLEAHRSQLMQVVDRALKGGQSAAAARRSGQRNLFADLNENEDETKAIAQAALPDIDEFPDREVGMMEKEVLGFYLSCNPLDEFKETLRTFCSHTVVDSLKLGDSVRVMLGGMVGAIRLGASKNPKPGRPSRYAMFDLEGEDGMIRCLQWADSYAESGQNVVGDEIVVCVGRIDRSKSGDDDDPNMIVDEVIPIAQVEERFTSGMTIRISERQHGLDAVRKLYEILRGYPGTADLKFSVFLENGTCVPMQCPKFKIDLNSEMRKRIAELLGAGNIKMIPSKARLGETKDRRGGRNGYKRNGGGR